MKKEYQQSTELEGQDAVMALRLGLTSRSRASADEEETASSKSHATALRLRFASSSVRRPGPRVEEKREKESMQKGRTCGSPSGYLRDAWHVTPCHTLEETKITNKCRTQYGQGAKSDWGIGECLKSVKEQRCGTV